VNERTVIDRFCLASACAGCVSAMQRTTVLCVHIIIGTLSISLCSISLFFRITAQVSLDINALLIQQKRSLIKCY